MLSLYKEPVTVNRIKKMDTELFLYRYGESKPFAFRSANNENPIAPTVGGNELFTIGAFSLYEDRGELYCIYRGSSKLVARISPLKSSLLRTNTVKQLEEYFLNVYLLDPCAVSLRSAFERFDKAVSEVAAFCGCLTDIMSEYGDSVVPPQYPSYFENPNCAHIAVSLPVISLMYRRISALRGFNFKVTVKDSCLCLIFSAKVVFPDGELPHSPDDIREYSVLSDILGSEGLIIGAKLREVEGSDENGECIYRLSLAISPQAVDQTGLLRSSVMRQKARELFDGLDIELDGKY